MKYTIREMKETEYPLLSDFLYEAIYLPQGTPLPPRTIIESPALRVYVHNFGEGCADHALLVEINKQIAGAVWVRLMKDYGHIDDAVPSLAISLYPQFRGFGLGTALMKKMLQHLTDHGFPYVSLSVQKGNSAFSMYKKLGFEVQKETSEEYIMLLHL